MYEKGKATEAAAHLEIDGVIDPADTRAVVIKALNCAVLSS
jgi:acetyl-CoA carboxylase carboxyltransferase component